MRLNAFLRGALLFIALAPQARADDLDYRGAYQRYQTQQSAADQAKSAYDREAQRLQLLQGQLASARSSVNSAQSRLNGAQATLDGLNRQIDSLESTDRSLESRLNTDRSNLSQAQNRLDDARRRNDQDRREEQRCRQELVALRNQLSQLQSAHAPEPQITAKQNEINAKNTQLSNLTARVRQGESETRDCESRVDQLSRQVNDEQRQLSANRDQIAGYDRQRDQALVDLGDARGSLSRAQSDVTNLSRQVALEQADANAAASAADREQSEANDLYSYYSQVKAAYDRALNAVYARADASAAQDAGKEGQERATIPGGGDGLQAGQTQGHAKGEKDGDTRDGDQGYRNGKTNASTDSDLAAAYRRGTTDGAAQAAAKAHSEDFPRGYDDALSARLAGAPAQVASLDVTNSLPTDAGGTGPTLSTNPLVPGSKPAPSFPDPQDPVLAPPAYVAPGVSVPNRDNRYYRAPCDDLVLAEFVPLCKSRYDSDYASSYDASYRAAYLGAYQPAFDAQAASAYAQALQDVHAATFQTQQLQGAHDQGVLDGFANALAAARTSEYGAGQSNLAATFAAGHLLVVRSLELLETDGDGVLAPGELASMRVVIDNYGGQASPKGKFRLRVTGADGTDQVIFASRDLPALAADTRTTLVGVTSLKAGQIPAGAIVKATGVIEVQDGAGYQTIHSFSAAAPVHFPLELTDLKLAGSPRVGQAVKATLTFKNLRNTAVPATAAVLSTNPVIVDAAGGGKISVPALDPGQTTTVDINVTPSYWVGENSTVPFLLKTMKDATTPWLTQSFPKAVHIDRDASLLVFDRNHRPLPSGPVDVRAGGQAGFYIRFNYNATDERGPFEFKAEGTSDPKISPADGSTTGIQLGYWTPGTSMEDTWVVYDIDQSLKGKEGWFMLTLTEGGTIIHGLMVYLNIK